MNRIKGLDSLRFISIMFVVIHHLITFTPLFLKPAIDLEMANKISGWFGLYGIHFFFSGSGFLITYMLQREQKKFDKISLGKFYIRRILRIWPAYYFVIFISLIVFIRIPFFSFPGNSFIENDHGATLAYFLFIPQFAYLFGTMAPFVFPTYTIGIEEQFYVIWGLLYRFFQKRIRTIFIALLIISILANIIHEMVAKGLLPGQFFALLGKLSFWYQSSKFGCIAIGALLALEYLNNRPWLEYLKKKSVQIIIYAVFFSLVIFNIRIPIIFYEQMGLITCLIFLSAKNDESVINYHLSFLEYLGKISYGIYLFHMYAILISCKLYAALWGSSVPSYGVFSGVAVFTIILSVFFGWISYYTIERFFLRLKNRFARI